MTPTHFARITVKFLVGAAVALAVVPTLLAGVGLRAYIVHGHSMAPTLHPNDAIIVRGVPAMKIRIGDVVTLDDGARGWPITHRVVGKTMGVGQIGLITKGDANRAPEKWSVHPSDPIGRLGLRLPAFGLVAAFATSPLARGGLVFTLLELMIAASDRRGHRRGVTQH
jgi:signal peptidase